MSRCPLPPRLRLRKSEEADTLSKISRDSTELASQLFQSGPQSLKLCSNKRTGACGEIAYECEVVFACSLHSLFCHADNIRCWIGWITRTRAANKVVTSAVRAMKFAKELIEKAADKDAPEMKALKDFTSSNH